MKSFYLMFLGKFSLFFTIFIRNPKVHFVAKVQICGVVTNGRQTDHRALKFDILPLFCEEGIKFALEK
jgi:hypothetical protein